MATRKFKRQATLFNILILQQRKVSVVKFKFPKSVDEEKFAQVWFFAKAFGADC